jgi:hypothetical protein
MAIPPFEDNWADARLGTCAGRGLARLPAFFCEQSMVAPALRAVQRIFRRRRD